MFEQLESKTNSELLAIYNGIAPQPLASWKRSKQGLIDRILMLDDSIVDDVPETVAEEPVEAETVVEATGNTVQTRTIREAALHWLCYAAYYEDPAEKSGPENVVAADFSKARSVGITYLDVIDRIKEEFPGCETTVACLRWYSVKVRAGEQGYEDYRLCQGRPRAKPSS